MRKATEQADDYTKSVKRLTDDYVKSIKELKEEADSIREITAKLKDELNTERENVRADADLKIRQLNLQFENLEKTINVLADETAKALAKESSKELEELEELRVAQTTLKEDAVAKQAEFKRNSKFIVGIYNYNYSVSRISQKKLYEIIVDLGFLTLSQNLDFDKSFSFDKFASLAEKKGMRIHTNRVSVLYYDTRAKDVAVYIADKLKSHINIEEPQLAFLDMPGGNAITIIFPPAMDTSPSFIINPSEPSQ